MTPHDGVRRSLFRGACGALTGLFAFAAGASAADLYVIIASQETLPDTPAKSLEVVLHPSRRAVEAGAPEGATWRGKFSMTGRLFQQLRIEAKLTAPGTRLFGRAVIFEVPVFHARRPHGVRVDFPVVTTHTSQDFVAKQFANFGRPGAFKDLETRALLLRYQTFRATATSRRERLKRDSVAPDYFDIRAVFLHVFSGGVLLSRNYRAEGQNRITGYVARGLQFIADRDLLDSAEWLRAEMRNNPGKVNEALNDAGASGRDLVESALALVQIGHKLSMIGKFTSMWRSIVRLPCKERQELLLLYQEEADGVPDGIIPVKYDTIGASIAECVRILAERTRSSDHASPEAQKRLNRSIDRAVERLDRSKLRLNRDQQRQFERLRRYLTGFKSTSRPG